MNTYKLEFDIVEFDKELLSTFHKFGLKLTKYHNIGNCDVVEFEGTRNQLQNWWNEYYDNGEDFNEYFEKFSELCTS